MYIVTFFYWIWIEGCIADAAGKREESRGIDDEKLMALSIIWDQLGFATKHLKKYMAEVGIKVLVWKTYQEIIAKSPV